MAVGIPFPIGIDRSVYKTLGITKNGDTDRAKCPKNAAHISIDRFGVYFGKCNFDAYNGFFGDSIFCDFEPSHR